METWTFNPSTLESEAKIRVCLARPYLSKKKKKFGIVKRSNLNEFS